MKRIKSQRDFLYYRVMYERAVFLSCIMVLICSLLVVFLFYAYSQRPDREFYASAMSYKITQLYPLS